MRAVLLAPLVVLALVSCIAAQNAADVAAPRQDADVQPLDPTLGAIRVSADWKQTVFVVVTEHERTVMATPAPISLPYGREAGWKPPEGYGPVGFWTELKPGRYELLAASPGTQLAQATLEVTAGKELWLNAKLQADRSNIRISQPLEKIGPTWSKQELTKVKVKYRD